MDPAVRLRRDDQPLLRRSQRSAGERGGPGCGLRQRPPWRQRAPRSRSSSLWRSASSPCCTFRSATCGGDAPPPRRSSRGGRRVGAHVLRRQQGLPGHLLAGRDGVAHAPGDHGHMERRPRPGRGAQPAVGAESRRSRSLASRASRSGRSASRSSSSAASMLRPPWSWRWRRGATAGMRFPVAWLLTWIVGLLAGFAVLYTSPGMGVRTDRTRPQSSLLSASGFSEALHGWQSTWAAIASQPAYYAAIAAGLLVGLLASNSALRGTSLPFSGGWWTRARTTLVVVLPAALVVVALFAVIAGLRQGYEPNGWLYQRAWTNFLVPALLDRGALRRRGRPLAGPPHQRLAAGLRATGHGDAARDDSPAQHGVRSRPSCRPTAGLAHHMTLRAPGLGQEQRGRRTAGPRGSASRRVHSEPDCQLDPSRSTTTVPGKLTGSPAAPRPITASTGWSPRSHGCPPRPPPFTGARSAGGEPGSGHLERVRLL